ncbi:GNAT family N-acetyltransferase [Intrasporangium sp. YIM S08009]|uniref:GNAT family N-acetyltransferase n=1 Tax=Intrasporangium zincisolvens TaxID=3080018 RepID=UPI002B05E772|nr:GNAT family N-acetyltransferase [Intrasporangium sp. YIM S08009]
MPAEPTIELSRSDEQSRYEAHVDDRLAGFAEFIVAKQLIVFTHTEVDPAFEGKGVGSALARYALDDLRGKAVSVLPLCPFIKGWIERHREYADLVYGVRPSTVTD